MIGGGDTGTDCVGTAMRQGCKSLVQIEILPRPPMERADDNPWPEWPKVYKLDYAQEEAAAKFGADPRVYVTTIKRLSGDAGGNVRTLTTVQISWQKDSNGRLVPDRGAGEREGDSGRSRAIGDGIYGPGTATAERAWDSNRCALERHGRAWSIRNERQRHIHRGGLPARSKSRRVGYQ